MNKKKEKVETKTDPKLTEIKKTSTLKKNKKNKM